MEKFIDYLKKNNIKYDDLMLKKLEKYYEYLIEYNKNVNLTAITNKNEVYIKHFADSLASVNIIPVNATVCDIGTGAGFPGVVLKIFRDDIKLILVDSLQKRVIFLQSLIKLLDINNVEIIHARAEDVEFKNKYLNSVDIVVARAVASMNTLVEYCLPYVKVSGKFIAYKSNDVDDEIKQSASAIGILGCALDSTTIYNIDTETERKLIIIKKIFNTSSKYPRGMNKPRLKPL